MSWAKLTNSLSYTTLNICYSKNNIYNIPRGKAFLFRRMMMKHSNLIARDHTSSIVKKQFCEVKKTRSGDRQKQTNQGEVGDFRFVTTYDPALSNIHNIIQNNLSISHTDKNIKKIFPSKSFKTLYIKKKIPKRNLISFLVSCQT